jgi:hypothetical protein
MLSVTVLYKFDDRIINECGSVGEIGIGRVTEILKENPTK